MTYWYILVTVVILSLLESNSRRGDYRKQQGKMENRCPGGNEKEKQLEQQNSIKIDKKIIYDLEKVRQTNKKKYINKNIRN